MSCLEAASSPALITREEVSKKRREKKTQRLSNEAEEIRGSGHANAQATNLHPNLGILIYVPTWASGVWHWSL
ncbi:Tyrosinase ustQ [Fusarium oxysporum f. sp. albedinis]|nr:Tyrosinase ustQ [Fusarium oxysporum f. sp. albedinis]